MWVNEICLELTQWDVATILPQYREINICMLPLMWFANTSFQMAMLSFSLLLVTKVYELLKWTWDQTIVPQQKHFSQNGKLVKITSRIMLWNKVIWVNVSLWCLLVISCYRNCSFHLCYGYQWPIIWYQIWLSTHECIYENHIFYSSDDDHVSTFVLGSSPLPIFTISELI